MSVLVVSLFVGDEGLLTRVGFERLVGGGTFLHSQPLVH